MSDGITAMYDSMDHYRWLCARYAEPVKYITNRWGERMEDCYGKHAQALEARFQAEHKLKGTS